jgi:hypothetical protein
MFFHIPLNDCYGIHKYEAMFESVGKSFNFPLIPILG